MKLYAFDRLLLLQLLPKEGDLTTLKIVRELRETLSFSEQEHAALKFEMDEEKKFLTWDKSADPGKEVAFGLKAHSVIADAIKALDKQKKIKEEWVPFIERFTNGAQPEDEARPRLVG